MTGELSRADVKEISSETFESYKNIKPEKEMSFREMNEFVETEFDKAAKEAETRGVIVDSEENGLSNETGIKDFVEKDNVTDSKKDIDNYPKVVLEEGQRKYYDDNGALYRIDNDLKGNCEYIVNGYDYKTDEQGRIIEAGGKLRIKEHTGHKEIKDSLRDIGKGDENEETDNKGHLIGDQFDGRNGLENAVAQDAKINQTEYRNLENNLAARVKAGDDVRVKIEPVYEGKSFRPSAISYTYSINGEISVRIFPNGKEKS